MLAKKLKDLLFILILGSISTCLLLGIKGYTYPRIAHDEEIRFKSTILAAAGLAYVEDGIDDVFNTNIRTVEKAGGAYYLSPDNFYIFEFTGRGLWGLIHGVVTVQPDLETIESIRIISQEETPGLGARISEDEFLRQFKNKKAAPALLLVLRRKATEDFEIDAISGASMTSSALIEMINQSLADMREIIKD